MHNMAITTCSLLQTFALSQHAPSSLCPLARRVAHAQMIPKWKRRPNDSFRVKNGHSWDYVLVFKVYDASEVLTKEQKKYSVRKVVERITSAGCETKMFFAVQRDERARAPP